MERAVQILRALLGRALGESARDAPALVDVTIESAAEPRLWARFSNGYRTSAPLLPHDCFAFCERHSAWDVESLRRALLGEARVIYAQMLQEEAAMRERQRRTWVAEQMRRLGRGIAQSLRPRREALRFPVFGGRSYLDERRTEAHERGMRLLKDNLTPAQLQQYTRYGYFEVIGGKTGKRYRIRHGRSMNIDQLDKNGRRVCGWCFFPEGNLVTGDVMLAQKAALELFEVDALKIANKMW
ncbi:MAG TPA: hypothetical protein VGF29_05260 [Hyphomicrobiaceae bacterium]